MKNPLFFFLFIALLSFAACGEDDEQTFSVSPCEQIQDLDQFVSIRTYTEESLKATLVGEWRLVATGNANLIDGGQCNDLTTFEQTTVIFGADNSITINLSDGAVETGSYQTTICGIASCVTGLYQGEGTFTAFPVIDMIKTDGTATFSDTRPVDGEFFYYEKQ